MQHPKTSPRPSSIVLTQGRVLNVSAALAQPSLKSERALEEALDQAKRGVIVIAAVGNQGTLGSTAITRHPWVIPVVACKASPWAT